jgi:hypothetical protein
VPAVTWAPTRGAARALSPPRAPQARPIAPWTFTAVAVASFGGPLALAGLSAPALIADGPESAGLAMVAAVGLFAAPMAIWLRYAHHVSSAGGLAAFVEAAAGRRVALAQAGTWVFSYFLYLAYTTVQIVYDVLPSVVPAERHYQSVLALAIPAMLAGVMIAGRQAAVGVIALIAVGQLVLAGVLGAVTVANVGSSAATFGAGAPAGALAKATAQTSLLYICGGLPLFLGGEIRRAATVRRGLVGAYAVTGLVVITAVAPLAAAPGLANTDLPGVSVVEQFVGMGAARAVGVGIAGSIAGVMLCEYLALTRLVHAIGGWTTRRVAVATGCLLVLAAPLSLIDPERFYTALLKPSLATLWLSQLIVFAVYPLFARRYRQPALPAWALSLVASGLAIYGLVTSLHQAAT